MFTDVLFYSITYLLIAITYLLLYSSPLTAIITSYILIKKIDYLGRINIAIYDL